MDLWELSYQDDDFDEDNDTSDESEDEDDDGSKVTARMESPLFTPKKGFRFFIEEEQKVLEEIKEKEKKIST